MPNALAHQSAAAVVAGGWVAQLEIKEGKKTLAPLSGAALAAICTKLPDILEPSPSTRSGHKYCSKLANQRSEVCLNK